MHKSYLAILLTLLGLYNSHAQECIYEQSEAIVDTLNATNYYPLAVGNIWEYEVHDDGQVTGLVRREVRGYAYFKEIFYYRVDTRAYTVDGNLEIEFTGGTTDYQIVTDSSIVQNGGLTPFEMGIRLNADFRSCYSGALDGADSTTILVDSLVPPIVNLIEAGEAVEYDTPAIKEFATDDSTIVFAHGFGLIYTTGLPSRSSTLVAAIIDGVEYGTSLSEKYTLPVGISDPDIEDSGQIVVYPNPASDKATVFVGAHASNGMSARLINALGQVVLSEDRVVTGDDTFTIPVMDFPNGIYLLVVEFGNTQLMHKFIVQQ